MCHIGLPDHGTRWQKRMHRLAELGEDWARKDAAYYAEMTAGMVKVFSLLKDAFDSGKPVPEEFLREAKELCAEAAFGSGLDMRPIFRVVKK